MFRAISKHLSLLSFLFISFIIAPVSADNTMPYPIIKAEYIVVERMLVKPGQEAWFEQYWSKNLLPVFEKIDGFMGAYMLANTAPTGSAEDETDFGPLLPLGPPDKTFLPHGGIHLNNVKTDTQINFDAVLKGTYNYHVVHFWRDSKSLKNLVPGFAEGWKKAHGKGDAWQILTDDYFTQLENHWDLVYRVVQ
jgi:hypothetical protein